MKLKAALKELWEALDKVPDCPMCKGTGAPIDWPERVYWKGVLVLVCSQCKGAGKV